MIDTLRDPRDKPSTPLASGSTFSLAPLVVTAFCTAGVALLCSPLDDEAIGLGLRLQARLSFALYILGLAGPGIHALVPSPGTAWLARQRPALYQAFAVSHLAHGIWILVYLERTPAVFEWNLANASGVAAFPLISLLLLGHPAPLSRPLGKHWTRVEQGVVAYAWVQFVGFFFDRLEAGRAELRPWYVLAIVISVLAASVAWYRTRRGTNTHPPPDPA